MNGSSEHPCPPMAPEPVLPLDLTRPQDIVAFLLDLFAADREAVAAA